MVELATIWRAAADPASGQYGKLIRLLMLSGARRGELAGLRWSEIENGVITVPVERSKSGVPFEVPITEAMAEILNDIPQTFERDGEPREFVFGSGERGFSDFSGSKRDLDKRIGGKVNAWTLHDFRRSVSTSMHEAGVAPHVVEAVLNHISSSKRGSAGTYNKATFRSAKLQALTLWGEKLMAAIKGRRIVVPLRPAAA
jgi:integrase